MNILLIEDDIRTILSFNKLLKQKCFDVTCVYSSEEGIAYAKTEIYDLIILEAMMPKKSGYSVAQTLRNNHCSTPILMMNVKSDTDDEVAALNSGADYYLSKPLDGQKLLACIHALLRRQGSHCAELHLGNTSLNLLNSTLSCQEQTIRLSAKELDIMRLLFASPNQILSKELVLCKVWGFNSNAVENHVEVYISLLRKKLKQIHSDIAIKTIRQLGYTLSKNDCPNSFYPF